jgi:hypothetical protein
MSEVEQTIDNARGINLEEGLSSQERSSLTLKDSLGHLLLVETWITMKFKKGFIFKRKWTRKVLVDVEMKESQRWEIESPLPLPTSRWFEPV